MVRDHRLHELKTSNRSDKRMKIEVGKRYVFRDLAGDNIYTVIEIIDKDAVRVDDHWKSTRWTCNVLSMAQ